MIILDLYFFKFVSIFYSLVVKIVPKNLAIFLSEIRSRKFILFEQRIIPLPLCDPIYSGVEINGIRYGIRIFYMIQLFILFYSMIVMFLGVEIFFNIIAYQLFKTLVVLLLPLFLFFTKFWDRLLLFLFSDFI